MNSARIGAFEPKEGVSLRALALSNRSPYQIAPPDWVVQGPTPRVDSDVSRN